MIVYHLSWRKTTTQMVRAFISLSEKLFRYILIFCIKVIGVFVKQVALTFGYDIRLFGKLMQYIRLS